MKLNDSEHIQYHRHLILDEVGESGQLKLKQAKVLVVGAGGLGCPIIQYLAAAGVGNIGIVDGDRVAQSNLQRQILFSLDDVGKFKSEVARDRMSALNPLISIQAYTENVTPSNAIDLFQSYDIIVDGSDNFPTRYLVNDAAILANKPLVFGSIFKFEGQVSVFNYDGGPTYRCLFPTPPAPGSVPNCSEIGVIGILPGIIGCLQANEVIKMILGNGEVLSGKLLTYNALNHQQSVFSFQKNESVYISKLKDDYELFCGIVANTDELSLLELQSAGVEYQLLDVRTTIERQEQHIGGLHIPLDQLDSRMKEIEDNHTWVVYCRSGKRSQQAIEQLKNAGYKNRIINLKGGIANNI